MVTDTEKKEVLTAKPDPFHFGHMNLTFTALGLRAA
jgi:hypothetical protein